MFRNLKKYYLFCDEFIAMHRSETLTAGMGLFLVGVVGILQVDHLYTSTVKFRAYIPAGILNYLIDVFRWLTIVAIGLGGGIMAAFTNENPRTGRQMICSEDSIYGTSDENTWHESSIPESLFDEDDFNLISFEDSTLNNNDWWTDPAYSFMEGNIYHHD